MPPQANSALPLSVRKNSWAAPPLMPAARRFRKKQLQPVTLLKPFSLAASAARSGIISRTNSVRKRGRCCRCASATSSFATCVRHASSRDSTVFLPCAQTSLLEALTWSSCANSRAAFTSAHRKAVLVRARTRRLLTPRFIPAAKCAASPRPHSKPPKDAANTSRQLTRPMCSPPQCFGAKQWMKWPATTLTSNSNTSTSTMPRCS